MKHEINKAGESSSIKVRMQLDPHEGVKIEKRRQSIDLFHKGGYQLGIDVGGTFTDLVVFDQMKGRFISAKTLSTHEDPSIGVANALRKTGIDFASIRRFVHASTFAINLILQRKGAKVGLITTKGFRDILELMREAREDIYDFQWSKPKHIVPRTLTVGVSERVDHEGKIIKSLDKEEATKAVKYLRAQGVDAIAVCFLFSFLNPRHEQQMNDIIREICPGLDATLSHEILPEIREYERTSTTVIDACLKPKMREYLSRLRRGVREFGYQGDIFIFKSNGGITSFDLAKASPVQTILVGPAAGVIAAKFTADLVGCSKVISLDMGGTSCDVSLIHKGEISHTTEWEIEWGIPVKVPFVDVHSVGAGGGTIAWFDKAGALRVGPQSAGASPGPVCYALGGREPTVTDANLVLGRLDPDYFLGGEMGLSTELARDAIIGRVAKPMDADVNSAAQGIVDVVNSNIVQAIRMISVERGFDPREFVLAAFGGAGAMHAVMLARALNIPRVFVPNLGGILSAFGLIVADRRVDYVSSYPIRFVNLKMAKLNELFVSLELKALNDVRKSGFESEVTIIRSADMRYAGQNFEINVRMPNKELSESDREDMIGKFNKEYQKLYGFHTDEPRELLSLRVTAIGPAPKIALPRIERQEELRRSEKLEREVVFPGQKTRCEIYRDMLPPVGKEVEGPLIIEKTTSTIVVPPGSRSVTDPYGNLMITLGTG